MMSFSSLSPVVPYGPAPVGSIMLYAGDARDVAQGGWLVCDGRELACDHYPELFLAIGYGYGGAGGYFRVPDLRAVPQPFGPAVTGSLVYMIRYVQGGRYSRGEIAPPARI